MPRGKRSKKIEPQEVIAGDQIPIVEEAQIVHDEEEKAVQYIVLQQQEEIVEGSEVVTEPTQVVTDPEELLKTYYTSHSNTLGDSWYICKKCPAFKTSHNSTMRDHINVEHMKIALKCTHCDFETLRFKTLNSHRKQYHGLGAFACWMEKCSFKTILTPRMMDHLAKKHGLSQDEAAQSIEALISSQPVKQTERRRKFAPRERLTGKKRMDAFQMGGGIRAQRKTDEERQYKIHYGEDGRAAFYQCLYCDFTSKMSQNIAGHVNAKHLGRQIKCEECSFSTFYPKNLAVHLKKLHGKVGKRCAVPGCKFRSIQDERMNSHLMEKHGGMYDNGKNTIFVDLNNCT